MSATAGVVAALIIIGIVIVIVLLWAIGSHNSFVRMRNLVQSSWRQIDVELHRRYDLIPNLVETVQGYAAHERSVFDEVTRARASAAGAPATTPAERAAQEDALSSAIGRLFAVAEAYPQLRSAQNFGQLQQELANTEDRIAAGRRFYNANVRSYNTKTETFPSRIIGSMFGFGRADYFEVQQPAVRRAPEVSFPGANHANAPAVDGPTYSGGPAAAGGPGAYGNAQQAEQSQQHQQNQQHQGGYGGQPGTGPFGQ